MFTVIDLFSGCGGMSWGLHKAGFKILCGIDNWPDALETFKLNHKGAVTICDDIREIDPLQVLEMVGIKRGELDCLIGGPPCQGFSKNVPASYRFLKDPRNQLFNDFLFFVEKVFPKVVVMENVAEIYNAYSGEVRNDIVTKLNNLGYEVSVKVLYAPDFGVPQRRRRCFFLANRLGSKPIFPVSEYGVSSSNSLFGKIEKYVSAWEAISDLPSLSNGEGFEPMPYEKAPENTFQKNMRKKSEHIYDHIAKDLRPTQLARLSAIGPGQGIKDLPSKLRPRSGYSGAYGRLNFTDMAPTITRWVFHPGSGRYGHPKDDRLITMREAARLQSFSDDFKFTGSYVKKAGQIGNAVPPLIMVRLGDDIKSCLAN